MIWTRCCSICDQELAEQPRGLQIQGRGVVHKEVTSKGNSLRVSQRTRQYFGPSSKPAGVSEHSRPQDVSERLQEQLVLANKTSRQQRARVCRRRSAAIERERRGLLSHLKMTSNAEAFEHRKLGQSGTCPDWSCVPTDRSALTKDQTCTGSPASWDSLSRTAVARGGL